jgi:transcription termination factor Rho
MSDEELLLDLQPADPAPAKKTAARKTATKKTAAAKKAPAKKAAGRKPAATKATDPELPVAETPPAEEAVAPKPKAPRRSAAVKKAAAMLAALQQQQEQAAAPVVAEKAPPPPASEPPAEPAPVAEPTPGAEPPAAPEAVAPQPPAAIEPPPTPAVNQPVETGAPATGEAPQPERKKSKFERWKERRERFRQEKLARRLAQQGQNGEGSGETSPANGEDERSRAPEIVLGPPEPADGILELTPKGYGFLRRRELMYAQHPQDPFISADFIRQYGLREGMQVKGIAQKGPRGPQITQVSEVNNRAPEAMRDLPLFEELKAINPCKKIQLETTKDRLTTRVMDMFTPVGRGQRGLIVAPPRAGKTTLLQHIAEAVVENHPAMHLMILLVDERPEEVTEFKRILPKAEIYASSNDQDVKSHTRIATLAIERAKRLVECGEHVFILMDSITRLARAFNNAKSGGATMSGGMGVGAMEIPRRLFAAARNTREAGSLTILATALIETGSRMDDLIFQEFKGTGNMELVLDRKIAEQFYYPAVNIFKSGTRREELLLQTFQLDKIHMLRRGLAGHKPIDAIQRVLTLMERYPSNAQMLVDLPSKG